MARLLALLCLFGSGELFGALCAVSMNAETKLSAMQYMNDMLMGKRAANQLFWADFRQELRWLIPLFFMGWTILETAVYGGVIALRGFVTGFGGAFLWNAYEGKKLLLFSTLMGSAVFLALPAYLFLMGLAKRFYELRKKETVFRFRVRILTVYAAVWLLIIILFAAKSYIISRLFAA